LTWTTKHPFGLLDEKKVFFLLYFEFELTFSVKEAPAPFVERKSVKGKTHLAFKLLIANNLHFASKFICLARSFFFSNNYKFQIHLLLFRKAAMQLKKVVFSHFFEI